jgi:hypothetical protein
MPTKTTKSGRQYEIDGKKLIWHADVEDDETPFDVSIPLRLKLKALRPFANADLNDVTAMFEMLGSIIPGQAEQLDEMDVNDFQIMFETWHEEYTSLNGASLGEASSSAV